jgi:hypothetical protein
MFVTLSIAVAFSVAYSLPKVPEGPREGQVWDALND